MAVGDIQGGEQRRRAMAKRTVRHPFDIGQAKRQDRLGPFQCLDLALLIDAQHQCLVRRVEVEPDDVTDLLDNAAAAG